MSPLIKETANVKQTPRGSVVVLGDRLLTNELSPERCYSLAISINNWIIDHNQRILNDHRSCS